MLKSNPQYEHQITVEGYSLYIPANTADYHMSRYVEATNQNIYSQSGANKDVLEVVMDEIILRCNDTSNIKTLRTDIASLANNIKYRLKYPVDEHCIIRMGAILSFLEYEEEGKLISENPDKAEIMWLNKKMDLAFKYPDLYAFFLSWGVSNTPSYREALDTLNSTDYFVKRKQAIASMMPSEPLQVK